MRLGRAVVHVEHEDGDDDGERDEDHGEEQVLADERDHQRGGRDGLGDDQQEHGQREQHGDAEGDLLAAVGGQVEDQHGQEGDEQAGDDHVDGVEKREAADVERVGDVGVDLLTAVVLDVVLVPGCVDDHPLAAFPEVLQVYCRPNQDQVDLRLIVGPGAKLHSAVLVVEGKVCDINFARTFEDGWWDPGHISIVAQ